MCVYEILYFRFFGFRTATCAYKEIGSPYICDDNVLD